MLRWSWQQHSDIQAHFFPLPGTDQARAKLDELIESLCIERAEVRRSNGTLTWGLLSARPSNTSRWNARRYG